MIVSTFIIVLIYLCSGVILATAPRIVPKAKNKLCGTDGLPNGAVHEGIADIKSYPWLGMLIYPFGNPYASITTVVLISRQMALATALDIDNYPKDDFRYFQRAQSRVVVGHDCSGPYIHVLEYSFHPDFTQTTYNTLALVQLDNKDFRTKLFPICPPPTEFENVEEIYAMSLTPDCHNSSMVNVYKMTYVDSTQCREFYRRADLDIETMWPTYMTCARGQHGGPCIWRGGTALVIRDQGQWKLLGVGTYGPGCESPARFLDYGMYHQWVKRSIARIGQPTITRISPNRVILRRTTTNVQRYGECDQEEIKWEIFTDYTSITPPYRIDLDRVGSVKYKVALVENVEYSCVVFRVWNEANATGQPTITLRRWCTNLNPMCAEFTKLTIFFSVEIEFRHKCAFKVSAYGREIKYVDAKRILMYANDKRVKPEIVHPKVQNSYFYSTRTTTTTTTTTTTSSTTTTTKKTPSPWQD